MNVVDILSFAAAAVVLSVVAVAVRGWRQRRAVQDAAAGRAPTVFAAIRRLDAGVWRGRWRHGFVTAMPGEIRWRPRGPRPGPPIHLTNVRLSRRPRRQRWYEQWWLAPGVGIYHLAGTGRYGGEYELAVVGESARLFEDRLLGRSVA